MTEQHKQRIGNALRGRRLSEETKQKMRGKIVSQETRAKISAALRGRKHPATIHLATTVTEEPGDVRLIPHIFSGGTACLLIYSRSGVFTKKQFIRQAHRQFPDALKMIAYTEERARDINHTDPHRRAISFRDKWAVFKADGYKCRRCDSDQDLTIDHIVPVVSGGQSVRSNYQTLCRPCNSKKGARDAASA